MSGARLEKTGVVFAGIRGGFFRTENDADAGRSFAAGGWQCLDRLLKGALQAGLCRSAAPNGIRALPHWPETGPHP